MMEVLFYIAAFIALTATVLALSRSNATHALIYLIVSLLAVAVIFFLLGAPFAAALEVLVYAGAIMVLFIFVIMMLNLGDYGEAIEHHWLSPRYWLVPGVLASLLFGEMIVALQYSEHTLPGTMISPKQVGIKLFGPYVLAVEIASMLLLAGLVGSYHLGRRFLSRSDLNDGQTKQVER